MLYIFVEGGGDADKNVRTLWGVVKSVRERTRGKGGKKSDYFERTYFLDGPIVQFPEMPLNDHIIALKVLFNDLTFPESNS